VKKSNIIWFILGGLALIVLGFVVGYMLHGGFTAATVAGRFAPYGAMPHMSGFVARGAVGGFPFLGFGLGLALLGGLIRWLGPIAGIVALVIVLTRKPAAAPAPPAQIAQPTAVSAPTEAESKPSKK
jgi:hypothetical protein